jgi:hypothetical protein
MLLSHVLNSSAWALPNAAFVKQRLNLDRN